MPHVRQTVLLRSGRVSIKMSKEKPIIIMLPPEKLTPYANNAKTHSTEQVDKVAGQISKFGFDQPVLVDKEYVIIKGHCRREAALRLQLKEIPVIVADHLSDYEAIAARIADNKVATLGEIDNEKLSFDLGTLERNGFNLEDTAYEISEIDDILLSGNDVGGVDGEDDIPDIKPEPTVKRGEVWLLGKHRLLCGDSTSETDVARLMNGEKVDMVFTDPPYGMNLDADYTTMKSKMTGSAGGNKYRNVMGDHADFSDNLIKSVFDSFPDCAEIFLWGADYYADLLPNRNSGSWIVWDKRGDSAADKMFGSCFELCWSKNRHKRDVARIKWAGIFGLEKEHDKKRFHPTQKPSLLIEWFFDRWGKDGDLVADLFGGSGSTLIACEKTNRRCFMMELDEHYCSVIVARWENFAGLTATKEALPV